MRGAGLELLSCEARPRTGVAPLAAGLCTLRHLLFSLRSFSQCFGLYKEATVFIQKAVGAELTKTTTLFFFFSLLTPIPSLTRPWQQPSAFVSRGLELQLLEAV